MADAFPIPTHHQFQDLTGRRFTRWQVVSYAGRRGALATVDGSSLRRGATSSCGCFLAEVRPFNFRSHGRSKTPEWRAWVAMRKRCSNPKDPGYAYYGGRGIYVCDEWKESFQAFYNAMGPRPSDSHSIDRFPDNDGPYAPWNCRWATKSQQAYNRRPKGA